HLSESLAGLVEAPLGHQRLRPPEERVVAAGIVAIPIEEAAVGLAGLRATAEARGLGQQEGRVGGGGGFLGEGGGLEGLGVLLLAEGPGGLLAMLAGRRRSATLEVTAQAVGDLVGG